MPRHPANEHLQRFRLSRAMAVLMLLGNGTGAAAMTAVLGYWLWLHLRPLAIAPAAEVLPGLLLTGLPFVLIFGAIIGYFLTALLETARSARDPRFDSWEIRVDDEGVSLAEHPEADPVRRIPWREVQDVWSGHEFLLRRNQRLWDGRRVPTAVFLRTGPLQPRSRLARAILSRRAGNSACEILDGPDFTAFSIAYCKGGSRAPYRLMRSLHAKAHHR